MKRLALILAILLPCILGLAQPSFPSKKEAMEYAKKAHNSAIECIQNYNKSGSIDHLKAALVLSGKAASIAQDCVSLNSDVLLYGPDAVRIVKNFNYVSAYVIHQIVHHVIQIDDLSLDFNIVILQLKENTLWMTEMLKIDTTVFSWLWGTITKQDIAGIYALIHFIENSPEWKDEDKVAGDKSMLSIINRLFFDLNLFTENGDWLIFD